MAYACSMQTKPSKTIENEKELITRSQAGDEKAFSELVSFYKERVLCILIQKGRNTHKAEDIAQLSWIKAWNKISTFRGESSFSTWCCRIAINTFFDETKKGKKYVLFEDWVKPYNDDAKNGFNQIEFILQSQNEAVSPPSPVDILLKKELETKDREDLAEVTSCLDGPMKRIIDLVLVKNLSYKDAAKKEGIPIGTVMSRIFYAKKKMQAFKRRLVATNKLKKLYVAKNRR